MLESIDTREQPGLRGGTHDRTDERRERVVEPDRRIVVGIDFSSASQRALHRAVQIARVHPARLHLVHAAPRVSHVLLRRLRGQRDASLLRDAMARVTKEVRDEGVPARPHVVVGGVSRVIVDTAREVDADLVVVGARGRRLPDAVLGSTAERIASSTRRSVLMVRRTVTRPYRRIIVAIDRGTDVQGLLAAARLVAPIARVSLLHAYNGQYENLLILDGTNGPSVARYLSHARSEARAALTPSLVKAGLDPRDVSLRYGSPWRVLEQEDRERGASDTLFVLARRRSAARELLLGSAPRWLIAHGQSDVLLV